jgi:hypothetical protein
VTASHEARDTAATGTHAVPFEIPSECTVHYFVQLFCSVIFTSVERPRKASDEIYWIPKRLTGEHKQGSTRHVVEVYSLLSMAVISVHLSTTYIVPT